MRTSILVLSCAGAALAGEGFVKLGLESEHGPRLRKRQSDTNTLGQQIVAGENGTLYFLNLTIGTPPQPFRLQLDTGSSDVVVPNSRVSACSESDGCPSGSYNPSDSSTYELISEGTFNNSYGDGTAYIGDYFTDVLDVGGIKIAQGDLLVGLANELKDGPELHNDGTGLVGVGYSVNSGAIVVTARNGTLPPTVVSAMVASGDIGREAYSLFLGDQESGQGSIIFGGVEPSLYTGDLVALPVLEENNGITNYTEFLVALTGISVTDVAGTRSLTDNDFAVPVLLDSGNTLTNLPQSLVTALNQGFGVTTVGGSSFLPCNRAKANVSITYHFGGSDGPSISVPLSALMKPQLTDPAQQPTFDDGENACQFKVETQIGSTIVLGDSFMRSGYFVFDLDNNQVAIAQAAVSPSSGGSVTALSSGTAIPGCSSTNTFTLDASQMTQTPEGESPGRGDQTQGITGSVLPATATFDIGSVSTETANVTPTAAAGSGSGSGSGGASSSSSSGGAMPAATMMAMAGLERIGMVVAAAVVGGVAIL